MSADPYLIPGSKTLVNKFGLSDAKLLAEVEQRVASLRAISLVFSPSAGSFDLAHMQSIHRSLFGDVYPWAGEVRRVNIWKSSGFAPANLLETSAKKVFGELAKAGLLQDLKPAEFVERAAYFYGEINFLHPFSATEARIPQP